MELHEYFENQRGVGVLATSDKKGNVNAALYARPRIKHGNECLFIMSDKLTHRNLQENPQALYLFKEHDGYQGKRLVLTKIAETQDKETIDLLLRERNTEKRYSNDSGKELYAVSFKIEKIKPLVGDTF